MYRPVNTIHFEDDFSERLVNIYFGDDNNNNSTLPLDGVDDRVAPGEEGKVENKTFTG